MKYISFLPEHQPERMTATEVQRLRDEAEASASTLHTIRTDFTSDVGFIESIRKRMIDQMAIAFNPAWIVPRELVGEWVDKSAAPAKPAKPHPLQKLADQPNCWGQSMWRPWE